MTALILGVLNSQALLFTELIKTQTPPVQLELWQRYLDLTTPLHAWLCKIEGITPQGIVLAAPVQATGTSSISPGNSAIAK
jgi:hypothetical protein